MKLNLLDQLWEQAEERSQNYPDEDFRIRGLWDLDIRFLPTPEERLFKYSTAIAQTRGQGCCYAHPEYSVPLDSNIVGKDARNIEFQDHFTEIAVLDAVYSVFDQSPAKSFSLEGDPVEKSKKRTAILVKEILNELGTRDDPSLLNIGVLGNVLHSLKSEDIDVYATDMESSIVGTDVHGVTVLNGQHNDELLEQVDAALVTGMTLATNSLTSILNKAKDHGTSIILFAETGSNFAEEYCSSGIDVVIREPFPFYIFQYVSHINVFYSNSKQDGGL